MHQLFSANSERRIRDEIGRQMILDVIERAERAAAPEIEIAAHRRRRAETANETEAQPIRFDETVPVVVIELGNREISHPENWTLVGEKATGRLTQRTGPYLVLRILRNVHKRKTGAGSGLRESTVSPGNFQRAAGGSVGGSVPSNLRAGASVVGTGLHRGRRWVSNVDGIVRGRWSSKIRTSLTLFPGGQCRSQKRPVAAAREFTECRTALDYSPGPFWIYETPSGNSWPRPCIYQ